MNKPRLRLHTDGQFDYLDSKILGPGWRHVGFFAFGRTYIWGFLQQRYLCSPGWPDGAAQDH
jgi:hypothetical protein